MAKMDWWDLNDLYRALERTYQAVPARSRKRELRYTFFEYAKNALKQVVVDAILANLMQNYEVQQYPEIAHHIAGTAAHYMDRMETFYEITGIDFEEDGTASQNGYPDLECLGGHAEFVAGKLAGGGWEKATAESAQRWYFIYRDYVAGDKSAYPGIMADRLNYWKQKKVAPMWYWFDESIATTYAYPYQQTTDLRGDIYTAIEDFLIEINLEPQEEAPITIEIESVPDEAAFFRPEPTLVLDVNIKIKGAGGEEIRDRNYVIGKLERGEWFVTKTYVTKVGGRDITVASIQRKTTSGSKIFTGYRLEYE